jgi:hypothetical protein
MNLASWLGRMEGSRATQGVKHRSFASDFRDAPLPSLNPVGAEFQSKSLTVKA